MAFSSLSSLSRRIDSTSPTYARRPSRPLIIASSFPTRQSMSHGARPPLRPTPSSPSSSIFLALIFMILVVQVQAILVSTFENCLSEFTRKSPGHLQFHPILVSADFNPVGPDENYLRLTVWGTVTGASSSIPDRRQAKRDLERPEVPFLHAEFEDFSFGPMHHQTVNAGTLRKRQSTTDFSRFGSSSSAQSPATYFGGSYKADFRFPKDEIKYLYTGSLVDQVPESWGNIATTLTASIVISSFEVYSNKTFFCDNPSHPNSIGAKCPFGNLVSAGNSTSDISDEIKIKRIVPHEYRNDVDFLTRELPFFTFERRLASGYQFASLGITLKIIAGDPRATHVGCVHIEVTPELQESYSQALTWIPVGILIIVGISSILAAMYNPWNGSTDVFKFSCNYGMDEDMIRLITPGFADCLQWMQFIVLTGSLSLNYPGFYQAVVSNGAWSILLLNSSLYSQDPLNGSAWKGDGLYAPQSWVNGFERLAQAVGLLTVDDIWVSVMAFFVISLVVSIVLFQIWFWGRWTLRKIIGVEEQDLTKRNWPFTIGLIYRFAFTYFLMPIVTVCTFEFTVASRSPAVLVVLASGVLLLLAGLSVWLTLRIWRHSPWATLFDDLPTLLKYGTFYNTYREKQLAYFIVQLCTNFFRGVAFGALQPSGIAQITILAVLEITTMLTIYGIQPFAPATSMNLWHSIFSGIRLATLLLMMAFVPQITTSDAVKGWAGWIILGIHAFVLLIGFVLKSMQTLLELAVRGYRHDEEASRGGFAKVFGVRQLSRRKRHSNQTLRPTSLTQPVTERKHNLSVAPRRPHSRSNSSAILLGSPAGDHPGLFINADGSQSGRGHSNSGSTQGALTPTSPSGAITGYGYLPPVDSAAGPYYRPPRTRRADGDLFSPGQARQSWGSELWNARQGRSSQGSLHANALATQTNTPREFGYEEAHVALGGPITPTSPPVAGHRYTDSAVAVGGTDYTVREVDFYYGVRGPALSTQPSRRLGTGPADPTGPVSNAKTWLKQKLGLARGEKEKGFSVVRSSRAPDAILNAQRDVQEDNLGGVGSRDSADADIGVAITSPETAVHPGREEDSLMLDSESSDAEDAGPSTHMLEKPPEDDDNNEKEGQSGFLSRRSSHKPKVPRKSSKRKSRESSAAGHQLYDPPILRGSTSRLPFEKLAEDQADDRSISMTSSLLDQIPAMGHGDDGRPDSVGEVHHGRVSAVVRDQRSEILGSQAELVRGGSDSTGSVVRQRGE